MKLTKLEKELKESGRKAVSNDTEADRKRFQNYAKASAKNMVSNVNKSADENADGSLPKTYVRPF